jgi:1,4-alpha-glucan branching enzyme
MVSTNPLGGGRAEVTFRMPALPGVTGLSVSGDFNGWSATAAPLARQADGSWTVTLVLEAGRSYRYRYCDSEGRWHNDWQADAYVPNNFGSEDSVVIVPAGEPDPTLQGGNAAKEPRAKKPAAEKPAVKEPAAKKPAAERPAAKKPAAKKPAAREPSARRARGGRG